MTRTPSLMLGGGLTGIAWETGILLSLERRGIHPRDARKTSGRRWQRSARWHCALAQSRTSASVIVAPDATTRSAMGKNSLDPKARAASAVAGLDQADRVADAVRAVWD